MFKVITPLMAVWASAANAAQGTATWDKYPGLICRANVIQFCTPRGCETDEATAVYIVDFRAGTIRAAVSKTPSRIIEKKQLDGLAYDVVITDGPQFAFSQKEKAAAIGNPSISGVKTDAGLPSSDTMWMDCNPL